MKKHFKGFTLIECLVALAILGIASLTMAQIYAGVSKRNKSNHFVNTSLSNQMAYVEKYTDAETVKIYYNGTSTSQKDPNVTTTDRKPPHSGAGAVTHKNNYVRIIRVDSTDGKTLLDGTGSTKDETYSFPVDTFVLYSRDNKNVNSLGKDESGNNVGFNSQYKEFFESESNPTKEDNYNLRYKYILGHKNT